MLNIVIITPGFPVDEKDTICLPFLQLYIHELIKQQIHVTVITDQHPIKENYTWNNVKVYTLRKKGSNLVSKLFKHFRLKKTLLFLHKKNNITAIHNFWFNELVLPVQDFAIKYGIQHITTFAGQDVLPDNNSLKNLDIYTGDLVCFSKFQQLKFNEVYTRKSELIHLGIDDIVVNDQPRSIDLISCGWINSIKNHSLFVDIVYELVKTNQIQKAVICGGGTELLPLIRKIEALNLQHIIEIKGSLQRSEVINLMQQSKILVHTSHYESFGLVLAEGLACNCFVVSTPVGIAFEDKDIIRCNTRDEFVREIMACLSGSTTLPLITKPYLMSETVSQYTSLYQQ